jgi:hypothetical protein
MMRRIATVAVAVLAASLAGTAAVPAVAQATTPTGIKETVIWSGLNTPRHIVLTETGLVVTEAGTGGPVGTSNCATGPATEGAGTSQYCTGPTGDIFAISSRGHAVPVLSKLPSVIEESIQEVTGPSAIAYGHGQEAVTIDDFLVNKDGSNSLRDRERGAAFDLLGLSSA